MSANVGDHVWVLTDETPRKDDFIHDGEDGPGLSHLGVYLTKEGALADLAKTFIGEENAATIVWEPEPENPTWFSGWENGADWEEGDHIYYLFRTPLQE